MIPFNDLPAALRLPGVYIEFDPSLASQGEPSFKALVIGQRLSTGAMDAHVPTRITNEADADTYAGRGSMLAQMLRAALAVDRYMETWALAVDEDPAGAAAAGQISTTGAATAAGTLVLYIAGTAVKVGVAKDAAGATVATDLAAAITADTSLPVTAQVNGVTDTQVDLACRWKGETGNDIDIRANYYGETTPPGLTVAITPMSGGTTNPDVTTALGAMGAEWYNWIAFPFNDAANLSALEAELDERWGPTVQQGARAFRAFRGNHAATGTHGETRNSPHVTTLGANLTPQPGWVVAAIYAQTAANPLALDPARPLQYLELKGMLAPKLADRWTGAERNLHLYDGIASYQVTRNGRCLLERAVTNYQTNAAGLPDIAYLDINRPETLERLRFEQRSLVLNRFLIPRFKLSSDSTAPRAAGQPILTATSVKAALVALYADWLEKGWVDDLPGYKAGLVVEVDAANGRVNWKDEPRLIGQARVVAGLTQFRI